MNRRLVFELLDDDLGVEAEGIDLAGADQAGVVEEGEEAVDAAEEVVGGVLVAAAVHGHVEHGEAAGAQGALDLGGEAVGVERVVEDVGELEVEGVVGEGLAVEVAAHDQRRRGGEVHADGAGDAEAAQGGDLLAEARADAERRGGVGEQALGGELGEEAGEDADLALPVAGRPHAAEAGVQRLVQLQLDVVVVGAEGAPDANQRRRRRRRRRFRNRQGENRGGGFGLGVGGEEEAEEKEGREEEEKEGEGLEKGPLGDGVRHERCQNRLGFDSSPLALLALALFRGGGERRRR